MPKIFKYFSSGVVEHVFARDGHVGVKCSLPQDYNDPFELFLGVDLDQGNDLLATYKEVVQNIPSLLTTCFSRSPVVAPMWAHYAKNHEGFLIGFETAAMEDHFGDLMVRDITYRDGPSEDLVQFARMAAFRCKPRDGMALRNAVFYHGYFSKYSEWGYEQEARIINLEDYAEDVKGNKILHIPASCVSEIICGNKASGDVVAALSEFAGELEADFYVEKIGLSYPKPYLVTETDDVRVFADGAISSPVAVCGECAEPLKERGTLCPWCAIDEDDEEIAASTNPFRILDGHSLLEGYLESYPRAGREPYKGS